MVSLAFASCGVLSCFYCEILNIIGLFVVFVVNVLNVPVAQSVQYYNGTLTEIRFGF